MKPKSISDGLSFGAEVSESDRLAIQKLNKIALELAGIQLNERHQAMVASRLSKRLNELGLNSLEEYVEYFNQNRQDESPKLVGLLTTHHTYFFREFSHFEMIQKHLPQIIQTVAKRTEKKIKVWVAACSRGQEAYSLAMFLDFHLKQLNAKIDFEIYGNDVDPESVAIAKNGVYLRNELKEVPLPLLGDHWVRGTGDIEMYVKAKKSLREKCRFQVANLLELKPGGAPQEMFDLVFCRNVFIYFNSSQIKSITKELLSRMAKDGYLFIGISESLTGLDLPVGSLGPSVYQHKDHLSEGLNKNKDLKQSSAQSKKLPAISAVPKIIRVLCVDDSPSILTLMKQILSKNNGFEVIGTAKNGLEAAKQVAALKPDALTLDIHMPEQTGIEYLEKNFKTGHPPVVMVTSVSRENADLAGKALTLGASDYVEKPALTNLAERGEEIRNKLRCAMTMTSAVGSSRLGLDQSFQKKTAMTDPDSKFRIFSMPLSSRSKLKSVLNELSGTQPPTVIFLEGARDALESLAKTLSTELGKKISYSSDVSAEFKANEIVLLDLSSSAQKLWDTNLKNRKVSLIVFGDISEAGANKLLLFKGAQLLLEDLGGGKGSTALMDVASDVVLSTSFAYLSNEFLCNSERKAA